MGQRISYFKNNFDKGLKDLLFENYIKFRQWYLDYDKYSMDEFNEPYGNEKLIAYFNQNMDLQTDFGNLDKNFIDELTAEFIGSYYDTTHQQNDMLEFYGPCINKWEYDKSTEMVLQTNDKDFIKLWNFLILGRSLKDNEEFDSFTNDYKIGFINRQEYLLLKSNIEFHFGNNETIRKKYWTNSEKLQLENAIKNSTNGSYSLIGHKPKSAGLEYVLHALNELTEKNKELITAIE